MLIVSLIGKNVLQSMLHILPKGIAFIYPVGCYQTRHDHEGGPKYPSFFTFCGGVTLGGKLRNISIDFIKYFINVLFEFKEC